LLTAAHTRAASLAEYTDSARWARPGMAKSLVVVPVDQGQHHLGVVAQLGRQA